VASKKDDPAQTSKSIRLSWSRFRIQFEMENLARIDELNRRFSIPGIAQVIAGNGGLAKIQITAPRASAEIYLHGAHLVSWTPAGSEETIFLSGSSHWVDGRAIRGGIPICFPWFRAKADNPKAPAHGFVRTREWRLDSIAINDEQGATVSLSTRSDDSTRAWWPHEFELVYRISIGAALRLDLIASNTGSNSFRFEEALHSYLRIGDPGSVRVHGLDQTAYLDNNDGNRRKILAGDLAFAAPTDYAFLATQSAIDLVDPLLRRVIRTEKQNSATTVVWNPWAQGAAAIADLGDDEWRQFACVEACNMLDAGVTLAPGAQHNMTATISVAPS
jgi:glucose-6-phosphate 1-epimerase